MKHDGTSFHSQGAPYTNSFDLDVKEWTVRLYYSLQPYVPQCATVKLTYDKGPEFSDYLFEYSHQTCSRIFYFQGAPDMIFTDETQKPIDLTVSSDSDSSVVDICEAVACSEDDDNDGLIEVGRAAIPVNPISHLPEKIGQVIAGLHFLATAKVIKKPI